MKSQRSGKSLTPHELTRFLDLLAQTGNFALACDRLGRAKSGLYKRRAHDPDFDEQCRNALDRAHAPSWRSGRIARGGEEDGRSATMLSTYAGRRQLRRIPPGTLTRAGRKAFLLTLAATGNIRFAAHSIGLAPSSIHARRQRDPDFAAEMKEALSAASDTLELRVIEASGVLADDYGEDVQFTGAVGNLTAGEALRLLEAARREEKRLEEEAPQPESAEYRPFADDEEWPEERLPESSPPNRAEPRVRRL